jgi:hypothetical protein
VPADVAGSRAGDGTIDIVQGSLCGWERKFTLKNHPKDPTAALASNASPVYPAKAPAGQRWTVANGSAGQAPPWSVAEFLRTAGGYRIGCAMGNLQRVFAGAVTTYDVAMLDLETLSRRGNPKRQSNEWDGIWQWECGLSWVDQESLS